MVLGVTPSLCADTTVQTKISGASSQPPIVGGMTNGSSDEAIVKNSDDEAADQVSGLVSMLLSNGADNIELSNDKEMLSTIFNIETFSPIFIPGNNNIILKPCISLIDDDTIDYMISSPTAEGKRGGFFSVLLPMMLSLGEKHGIKMPVGLACEGHRVGLTPYMSADDSYTELNKTGNAIKWLHNNMNWNVFNHSMTAQLPQHTYYVDGINSSLANTILSRGQWLSDYNFWNTIVLDRLTGKWYECRKEKGTKVWAERTPTKKYAMPFYREYINPGDASANHDGPWHFNRDFDFDYSWGEWFKRADELGLPYEKVIVHNGGTSHVYTAAAGRKYAYFSVRTSGIYNYPPIPATVNRADGDPSGFATSGVNDYNVYNEDWVNKRKEQIDDCIANNYWMILMTHFNDSYFSNYYGDDKNYPAKDEDYPEEWILPLKVVYNGGVVVEDEIQSIMDGTHDYIHIPPARLGISSWSQWHPAPGTHLAALYEVLDYALTQGVDFISPWDGWKVFGNILNIGVDKMSQSYSFNAVSQTPYTDEEKSYLTIGADMSIRYFNSKNNYFERYVDALAQQDYEMPTDVAKAVKRFVDTLTDYGLMEYIQAFYPFIGDSSNKNAAKEPLIGKALLDFPDNFDGLSYDRNKMINGITKTPSISNLKLSDVQPDGDFVGAAYSINKSATASSTYLDRIMNFSNKYQLRLQNNKFAIYCYLSTDKYGVLTASDNLPNKNTAGSLYMLGAFSKGKYLRYAEKDGIISSASGSISSSPQMSDDDLQATLSSSNYPTTNLITSITFLKKMMTKEQARLYMDALKTLMTDLERNVSAGTTPVDNIVKDKNTTNYGIFNLNGQQLLSPQRGINIIDRKKVVVK